MFYSDGYEDGLLLSWHIQTPPTCLFLSLLFPSLRFRFTSLGFVFSTRRVVKRSPGLVHAMSRLSGIGLLYNLMTLGAKRP